jgi:DNA primase catalytic core
MIMGRRYIRIEMLADSRVGLAAVTGAAAEFFAERMRGSWGPGYLAARGFGEQDWRRWGIGYAPASWTALTSHLRARGFNDEAIQAAGVAKVTARGTLVDVFRDRIMFPVRALDGTVAGFIGRAPPSGKPPVYLNTATTALYHKGSVLFGLYEARSPASLVLTEGPLDAMAVTVAGAAGVASCGTALTAAQAALLASSGTIVVAFDGDRPGRQAAVRAYHRLREVASDLSTVPFPAGQDPAGFLREHGASALARLLTSQAHPLADLAIDECLARFAPWLQFTDGKFGALHAVAPRIAELPAGQVARQVARTASRLDLTHAEVTAAVTAAVLDVI